MTHHVNCVAVDALLGDAARLMVDERISSIIVVDRDKVLGIVTERDMLRAMREHCGPQRQVSEVMTSPVHTVPADMEFREAFQMAAGLGICHLVVCEASGKPLGVVTESDFRRHLGLDFFRQLNTVDGLMERVFPRLPVTACLDEALLAMEAVRASCVVVMEGKQPVGIITERDVVRLFLSRDDNPCLAEVMTHPLASVLVNSPVATAAEQMMQSRIRHLLVLDQCGQLAGLLTEHSLLRPLEVDWVDEVLADHLQLNKVHHKNLRQLARSEQYQRALLDNFPFLVWLKDTESRFLAVNQPLAEALGGQTPAHFLGKTDFDFSPFDLAERYRRDDLEIMLSGQKKYVVEPIVDHGKRRWFETYKAPVSDVDGALLGTVGFSRDISERKNEEEATLIRIAALAGLLRGERLEGVLELLMLSLEAELHGYTGAIFRFNPEDNCLHLAASPSASDAWRAVIERLPLEGGPGFSVIAARRRQTVTIEDFSSDPQAGDWREMVLAAGIRAGCSVPLIAANGELLGVLAIYHAQPGRPQEYQELLLTQCSQVAVMLLDQYAHANYLDRALKTFRGMFDNVIEALFVQAADGTFLDVNRAAEHMFAIPASDLVGQSHEFLAAEGLNELPLLASQIRAASQGEKQCVEFWGRDAGGRIFPCEVNLHPSSYFGRPVVLASVLDITERKAAAQRLQIEHDLASALVSGLGRADLLSTFLDIALRFPEFDCGGVYWRMPDGAYALQTHHGLSEAFVHLSRFLPADSPQAHMLMAGEVVCSCCKPGECCTDLNLIHARHLEAEGLRCLAVVPVMIDGMAIACLNLAGRRAYQVTRGTFDVLQSLRQHFAHALMRLDAREAAIQMQKNLGGLFDTLRDFLFILDGDGLIQHYNSAVTDLLGYAPDELLGQPIAAVHPQESREMTERMLARMLSGECNSCSVPLICRDGRRLMVETRVIRGFWNGEPALFGLSQDISDRLLAEERQRLAASVFENAHEGIMVTDPMGRIVEVNPTFCELTGYSRSEAIGQMANLLKSGHHQPDFYAGMWTTIQAQGYWRGEMWNRKKSGEIFVELLTISTVRNAAGEISHFVGNFSDITALKEHQQRLEHMAHFDALTQLPNRMLLADRLHLAMAQTERSGQWMAIAYLDLDGFKAVNDELGHATGDRLLVDVAQRLRQCVRAGDTVARLGGDEFVLLFLALDNMQECDRAASRVLAALSAPFLLAGKSIEISASIGITLYPQDGSDADTLLRHADQAMYAAKQGGRNRFNLFDPENERRARVWRDEQGRIAQALQANEFVLYYQPKVNMREGRVQGAEALIRWQHPERGVLLPAEFLPVIAASELDRAVGQWVMDRALQQLESWLAEGFYMSVSVNVSGAHLLSPGFVDALSGLLARYPSVQPQQLELEILETAALEDMTRAAEVFTACRQLGVSFALDDFGTGYSSLTYFRRLPADVLKIDQSFVRDMLDDPDDLAIVEGIVGLTQAFQRKVIAEGVETAEHGMLLLQLGCDLVQGFGIALPMPAEQFPAWVAAFVPDALWSSIASFKWSREDLPMLLAEGEHLRWMSNIDICLENPSAEVLSSLVDDHRMCRFGQWYEGVAQARYSQFESYPRLGEIHFRLHTLGKRLVFLRQQQAGDVVPDIPGLRAELGEVSRQMSEGLQLLQAEVLMSGMCR